MAVKRDNIDLIVSTAELTSVFDKKSSLSTLLQDIVKMVADHMNADVCSIYLYNEINDELVLSATVGLAERSIGTVKLKPGEGITGTALKDLKPVREARASSNPAFKFFKDINEERYEAFLAVPIKKGLNKIGVITLQHKQPDYFTARDAAALKAIASQMAPSIEDSLLLMGMNKRKKIDVNFQNKLVKGSSEMKTAVSGRAFMLSERRRMERIVYEELAEKNLIKGCLDTDDGDDKCVDLDTAAFDRALELSMQQLEELQVSADDSLSDVAGMIFTAHFLMLRDDNFTGEMRKLISDGMKPDESVKSVSARYSEIFENSELPEIREKVQDVQDLEHRLLANLYGNAVDTADYSQDIVVAEELYPSELVKLWLQKAKAIVLFGSSTTAHIAILARSLSIPLFVTDDGNVLSIPERSELILDSTIGCLYINPSEEIVSSYKAAQSRLPDDTVDDIPDETFSSDGIRIHVQANINIIHDIETSETVRAEGIGLYRSEFPFLIRHEFPSEEEQYRIYSRVFAMTEGQDCVFRTLDIGGDKMPGYAAGRAEANPFLGFRGIRFSLGHIEIFHDQLRAMLRAAAGKELKIMFPMVSSIDEFEEAKKAVEECSWKLRKEGSQVCENIKVGAMVELPAAVEIIELLSEKADFLSIGTNDLIMYTLAVDRTNERVKDMFKACHPAILKSIDRIAKASMAAGTELSVCGEAASDPAMLRFMLGAGIRRFSFDPLKIPQLKQYISGISVSDCRNFTEEALSAGTIKEAEALFSI